MRFDELAFAHGKLLFFLLAQATHVERPLLHRSHAQRGDCGDLPR
jgi:hypothetical protein